MGSGGLTRTPTACITVPLSARMPTISTFASRSNPSPSRCRIPTVSPSKGWISFRNDHRRQFLRWMCLHERDDGVPEHLPTRAGHRRRIHGRPLRHALLSEHEHLRGPDLDDEHRRGGHRIPWVRWSVPQQHGEQFLLPCHRLVRTDQKGLMTTIYEGGRDMTFSNNTVHLTGVLGPLHRGCAPSPLQ